MISVTYITLLNILFLLILVILFFLIPIKIPCKKYSLKYFHTDDGNLQNGKYIEIVETIDKITLSSHYIRNKNKLRNIGNMKYILLDIKEIKGGNDEQ